MIMYSQYDISPYITAINRVLSKQHYKDLPQNDRYSFLIAGSRSTLKVRGNLSGLCLQDFP